MLALYLEEIFSSTSISASYYFEITYNNLFLYQDLKFPDLEINLKYHLKL